MNSKIPIFITVSILFFVLNAMSQNSPFFKFNYQYSKFKLDTINLILTGKIIVTNIGKKPIKITRVHQNNDITYVRPNFADTNWTVKPNGTFELEVVSSTFNNENHYFKTQKSKLLDQEIVNQDRVLPVSFIIYYCLKDSEFQVKDSCFTYYHKMKLQPIWLTY